MDHLKDHLQDHRTRVRIVPKLRSDDMYLHIHRLREVRQSTKTRRWNKTQTGRSSNQGPMAHSHGCDLNYLWRCLQTDCSHGCRE